MILNIAIDSDAIVFTEDFSSSLNKDTKLRHQISTSLYLKYAGSLSPWTYFNNHFQRVLEKPGNISMTKSCNVFNSFHTATHVMNYT